MSDGDELDLVVGDFPADECIRKATHQDAPRAIGERPALRSFEDFIQFAPNGQDEAETETR